ncbi:MAG: glycosyltransferase family 39 protein [Candidatus Bathyarchaeota archaeon]|nr:glycosyltransferase family 39 protein [Candidatus Bathyarchaeota archaeon]
MTAKKVEEFLCEHSMLILVLVGSFLITAPMGTYSNWDAQLEYEATASILTTGYPTVTTGLMINQPPLGFYTSAATFAIFGASYLNGVALVTVFGLGCVAAVYALGTVLYGKKTGLAASALFGFVPWHVYMSRIFLIDNQYLFLSLTFLTLAVLAVKRNSERLVLAAGVVFALAFLTKLFAVFTLIPLLLFITLNRKESTFKLDRHKVLLFVLPSLILQTVWFGGFANQHFFGVYFASDFTHPELVANPVPEFLPIIYVKSAGWFLFAAVFFSAALAVAYRRQLKRFLRLDLVCLGAVAAVMALDMLLVLVFHLTVPYVSAVKYNYFALPFLCLAAASIADKGHVLIGSLDTKKKIDWIKPALVLAGLLLVFASLVESTLFVNAWYGFVSFGVDSVTYYGFYLNTPVEDPNLMVNMHFVGLALTVVGLVASAFFSLLSGTLRRRVNSKVVP